jgi:hypothetical protein
MTDEAHFPGSPVVAIVVVMAEQAGSIDDFLDKVREPDLYGLQGLTPVIGERKYGNGSSGSIVRL